MKQASRASGERHSGPTATGTCASATQIRSRTSWKPLPASKKLLRPGKNSPMKRIGICLVLLLCAALPALTLVAQQSKNPDQAQPDSNSQTLSVNVDLVNVIFTVADKSGKLVTRLPKDNFKVFEDDKA